MIFAVQIWPQKAGRGSLEVGKTVFLNLRRSNCDDIKTPRASYCLE